MKKLLSIFILTATLSVFNSCNDEEELYFEGDSLLLFEKDQQTAADGDYILPYGVTNAVNSDHNVSLVFDQSKSTAILGTDFTIIENSDVIKSGTARGGFKLNITKAAAFAKKQAVFTMSNSSLNKATFNQEAIVNFACQSALAGAHQYSTVNYFTPDSGVIGTVPRTGTVVFTATPNAGEYNISDASFGAYAGWYGGVSGNVKLLDVCNAISFSGPNQYGDITVMSNIVVSGNKLTFKWTTSYGEYGTTTLTKASGDWPPLN